MVPTTTGVTTAGCYGPSNSDCEGVIETSTSSAATPCHLAPTRLRAGPERGRRAGQPRRRSLREDLRKAKTFGAQAAVATRLAAAHRRAAASIAQRQATPSAAATQDQLAAALRSTAAAYGALARATRQHKENAYDQARDDIAAGEAAVRRAIKGFGALGYKVP